RRTQNQVDGVLNHLGEAVGGSGGLLNAAGAVLRVRETVAPLVPKVVSQVADLHRRDVVQAVLLGEHLQNGMAEYGTLDVGGEDISLVGTVVQALLLGARQVVQQVTSHARPTRK